MTMLQDTIGAIGDKGDDWIGQLRFLYQAQKRENDRHSLLLRGHARIVLLQLIQHFDSDHSLRLNQTELSAAEAFLTAGFPEIDIKHLEGKAAKYALSRTHTRPPPSQLPPSACIVASIHSYRSTPSPHALSPVP